MGGPCRNEVQAKMNSGCRDFFGQKMVAAKGGKRNRPIKLDDTTGIFQNTHLLPHHTARSYLNLGIVRKWVLKAVIHLLQIKTT